MRKKRTRLPSGPGGPISLRPTRIIQVEATSSAILDACDFLLAEGTLPTVSRVVAISGYSTSTVNRERYRSVLRAAKACFDLMAGGMPLAEARAAVGQRMPAPRDVVGKVHDEDGVGIGLVDATARAMLQKVERLTAEVERRDGQLYHTLAIVRTLRASLRWHRTRTAELERHLQALTRDPLPARTPRRWSDDLEAEGLELDDVDDE